MKKQSQNSLPLLVSFISIGVNLILSLLKLGAGVFGHSQAMVADAIHSASDVLSTIIVIAALLIARRDADDSHEYGHDKYESLAALLLSLALAYTGIRIGAGGVKSIITQSYLTAAMPTVLTIAAAAVSIVTKEAMFHVTMAAAKGSEAMRADAWHHRSDALSSVGSLAGILFARAGLPIMDPIACLVICVFILRTAVDLFLGAVRKLTDSSCSPEVEKAIRSEVAACPQVRTIDLLKTRQFGSGYYVDLEIALDGALTLTEAHNIAESVHDRIEERFPDIKHCMIHVNPAKVGV